jgi:hypothetical protein
MQTSDELDAGTPSGYRYRPKVICIEFNPSMPIDLVYVQPCDDNIRHGSSLSPYCDTLATVDQKRDCHTKLKKTLRRRDLLALVRGFDIAESICKDAIRAARSLISA